MDLFDDFEMKPITPGLGFHKRKATEEEIIEEVKREIPKASANQAMGEEQELQELMSALDRVSTSLAGSMVESTQEKNNPQVSIESDIEIIQPLPRKSMHGEFASVSRVEPPSLGRNMPPIIEDTPVVPLQKEKIPNIQRPNKVYTPKKVSAGTRRGAADSPVNDLKPAVFSFSSALLDMMVVLAMSLLFLITNNYFMIFNCFYFLNSIVK